MSKETIASLEQERLRDLSNRRNPHESIETLMPSIEEKYPHVQWCTDKKYRWNNVGWTSTNVDRTLYQHASLSATCNVGPQNLPQQSRQYR